jgi:selenocysteine-specific elongation factor
MLTALVRLLPTARRPLRYNAPVSFHAGTSEVMARVRLLEREELEPGDNAWAQLVLRHSAALVKGDRFIIRSTQETLGRGTVVEPHAKRYRRYRPAIIDSLTVKQGGSAEEVMVATLEASQPLERTRLLTGCGLPDDKAKTALEALLREGKVVAVGQRDHSLLFTSQGWVSTLEKASAAVQEYHRRFPARPGMPRGELGSKLGLAPSALGAVLQRALDECVLVEEGSSVRLASHHIELTRDQQARIDAFLESLAKNPYSPPGDTTPDADLLSLLIRQRRVVRVGDSIVFEASAYDEMVSRIIEHIRQHGKVTLAEVRDLFNTSRKYAQAILEHLDREKVTRRVGDERVLGSASRNG